MDEKAEAMMRPVKNASNTVSGKLTKGMASAGGAAPRMEAQMTYLRPILSPSIPPATVPDGEGEQKGKEAELRCANADAEFVDEEEGEIIGDAGHVKIFRKDEQHENQQRAFHLFACQIGRLGNHLSWLPCGIRQAHAVPAANAHHDGRGRHCSNGKPTDGFLSEGEYDGCCEKWADCRTSVAANLENALRKALSSARCQLGHPRGFGMENGGAESDGAHGQKQ